MRGRTTDAGPAIATEHDDVVDTSSTTWRLGWLQTANKGRFVVYDEIWNPDRCGIGLEDRSFTVEYSETFDLPG
jgi:hypothetical protein